MLPLDGYVRVSRVGGRSGDGFISPGVQEHAIRQWGDRNGVEVVVQPHELDVSGGTMDRPVFNRIMERVRRGDSGGFVVYKLDRFSRSLLGAVATLEELGRYGATFASATEPQLDYTTPAGRAFVQQMFVFAEFVRSTLAESWAVTQRNAIERGIHISPNSKRGGYLGYTVGPDRRLVPDDQAPTAVELFRRRGGGEAWGSLAEWLNTAAPRPDGTRWTGQAVQRLCAKRIYRGEASRYVDQDKDGRGPVVNRDAHPALVTEAEWQAAQMDPRIAKGGRNGKPAPLLSELIRCQGCRYSLSLGRGPKGERLYRCRAKHASGQCPSPASILADTIEGFAEAAVLDGIDGLVRFVPDSRERERVMATLEQARSDLEAFRGDRAARRKLGDSGWHEWLDDYLRAVREAEVELERLNTQIGAVREGLTRDHYLALPQSDRREVLAGFIDTIVVRRSRGRGRNVDPIDTRVRILWRGEAPADLPRRRVSGPIVSFEFEQDVEPGMVAAQHGAERIEA
jgi:site-specific DNA recombinase